MADLCSDLGVTRQTLYRHVAPNGTLRKDGSRVVGVARIESRKERNRDRRSFVKATTLSVYGTWSNQVKL